MPPLTRGAYIHYQTNTQPHPAPRDAAVRAWTAKSRAQRAEWTRVYRAVQRISTEITTHIANELPPPRNDVRVALIAATGSRNERRYNTLFRLIPVMTGQLEILRHLYGQLKSHWQHIRVLENRHPMTIAESLFHIDHTAIPQVENDIHNTTGDIQHYEMLRDVPPVPPNANGQPKIPQKWVRPERRWALGNANRDNGRRQGHPGLFLAAPGAGYWVPQQDLNGGMSLGTVWLQFDHQNHQIIDRVFRKDVHMNEASWTDPRRFEGDVRDDNNKTPWELVCHDALDGVLGLQALASLRERLHRGLIDNRFHTYKLYLEWQPNGDLLELIKRHAKQQRIIPEPMVWWVAECLVECGLAMVQGDLNQHVADWDEIVHRDLKPENVFLGQRNAARYAAYPMPKVADFGISFRTFVGDLTNPHFYNNGSGTPHFVPPEQKRWYNPATLAPVDDWRLSSRTNVYGVGLILWCLVTLREEPPEPKYLGNGIQDTTLDLPDVWPANQYSQALRTLIGHCLRYHAGLRPTFHVLSQRVQQNTSAAPGGVDRSRGMRDNTARWGVKIAEKVVATDRYRMGMARRVGMQNLFPVIPVT